MAKEIVSSKKPKKMTYGEMLEQAVKMGTEIGVAKAIEMYKKKEAERKKTNADNKLKNVKALLKEYRNLRAYAENALCDASQINDLVVRELIGFSEYEKYKVESIKNQIVTTKTIMEHVDIMLHVYRLKCLKSDKEEVRRRWRVIESMYLVGDTQPEISFIAIKESIDGRTVYKDIDKACDELSNLIFGIDVTDL